MDIPEPQGQLIKSSKEIHSILHRLIERATPITIHPDESSSLLTTYIESFDDDNHTILLDSPLPAFRHSLLSKRLLSFTTRYNGCLLTLPDMIMSPIMGDEDSRFLAPIPKQVYLLQRRESYRAPVRPLLLIRTDLSSSDEKRLSGRLKDLSVGGCCIVFTGDMTAYFQNPEEVHVLVISFPNGTEISVNVKVLRAVFNEGLDNTVIGCCFVELTVAQEQYFNKVVGDLQRDFISHNRGVFSEVPALFVPKPKTVIEEKHSVNQIEVEPVVHVEKTNINQASQKFVVAEHAPVDIKKAYLSALSAVKSLINHFRADKNLPIEQVREACFHLLTALKQDRQGLIIFSRQRNLETYLLQHSISYAVTFADVIANQFPEQSSDALLERVLLGGLCHNVAQASLPEGLQHYELLVTDNERALHVAELNRLVNQLEKIPNIPSETLSIVRDFQECLDGSGIPNSKTDSQLNRVSRLASAIYAHERLSHQWYQEDWYFHPLKAFKQLIDMPEKYHNPSVRVLLKQYGKYPLGASVRLSDQTLALVMRHDEQGEPSYLRVVYDLNFDSLVPPRDIFLPNIESLKVERLVNPKAYKISSKLLKLALRD
ncbi:MAG: hypothetical protein EA373_12765 [Oceanospirillales bacterium]|nr:MAG: hypothetical protein EA373_12765 [Oceanospirillales bacterium]